MTTASQLAQYCVDHGYSLKTQGTHMFAGTLVGDAIIAVGGFLVGHYGIPATWTALKSIYAKIRSEFSAAKATPTVAVTPAA